MDRRNFLKIGAGGLISASIPFALKNCGHNVPVYAGWRKDDWAAANFIRRTARPYFVQQAPKAIQGSGKGRVVLLYRYLERAIGNIIPHEQALGDCIGQSFGLGVDTLAAARIYHHGYAEKWVAKASTEAIYAGSRYEIGYKKYGNKGLLRGEGSRGEYAAQYLHDYGVLVRKKYGDIDLTKYDAELAQRWGETGVPDELEPIAKKHPIRSFALVRSYEDVRDAIANGYPVILCSSYGFNPYCRIHNPQDGRDEDGFLNRCGNWYHAICALGVDDTRRPGVLAVNSWGPDWLKGPKRHKQPDGSFWIDSKNIDGMCAENDSFAISNFVGFPVDQFDYILF